MVIQSDGSFKDGFGVERRIAFVVDVAGNSNDSMIVGMVDIKSEGIAGFLLIMI
jgi:hypothetical protein